MTRLRRSARLAFCLHLVAGFAMATILRRGLETNPDLQDRLSFILTHRLLWSSAWLCWTAAALAILYFYMAFAEAYGSVEPLGSHLRFAVWLTVAAIGPDFAAQALEIGVLPGIAREALSGATGVESFLMLHRVAVMMSGYLANGLYSLTALILAWSARRAYLRWVWLAGIATGLSGLVLSGAALADSVSGMFWSNVVLVPALLLWLAGIALERS